MIDWIAERSGRWLKISEDRVRYLLHSVGIILAVGTFVLTSTLLVAYDSIFLGVNNIASLQIGDIAPQDIRAPASVPPFISQVLTEQRKQEIRDNVSPIYFPPDPAVSRQQSETAQQILEFIQNIRRDAYGTPQQKIDDLKKITDLKLDDSIILQMLTLDEATWVEVGEQVTGVLERVMRGEIRDTNLQSVIAQLPIQVSVRFSEDEAAVIVAVVQGLIRPNTILNVTATEEARQSAITDIVVRRSFERGQVVLRAGERVDAAAYEALSVLGLLEPTNRRLQQIMRAMLVSITVLVVSGLYIARFKSDLFHSSRFIALLASIFLITLLGARIVGFYGQIYVYPTAALALLFVALIGPEIAVIGVLGLSLLIGIMQENSLEIATLVGVGGMMATLTLRRPERLNGYFMPGLLVALANVSVVMIFYQGVFSFNPETGLLELIFYCLLNGILSAALALAGMYIVTLIFNLPTGLKLVELSQPSQPLLQRLLREAPGTYQHSLQVANMAEQAATRIGVNADLVRVAALYHDVGKMMNPAFFTENQVEGVNPHDALDDPARSATIIIAHVTDGDKIARQFRLPSRI
ncbi:MAG: HDIG domain-containing protein, partial [Anaerolineae bacterium]|nr:HDIG domain-containing protein [Anaerolineae bacterium]